MVFLVLTAMFHLTIATHYCGGHIAASEISVTGKLATCGMEANEVSNIGTGTQIRAHCCEDFVTSYNIDNNYAPSSIFLPESENSNISNIFIVENLNISFQTVLSLLITDVSPPGLMYSTDVELSDICVFRI